MNQDVVLKEIQTSGRFPFAATAQCAAATPLITPLVPITIADRLPDMMQGAVQRRSASNRRHLGPPSQADRNAQYDETKLAECQRVPPSRTWVTTRGCRATLFRVQSLRFNHRVHGCTFRIQSQPGSGPINDSCRDRNLRETFRVPCGQLRSDVVLHPQGPQEDRGQIEHLTGSLAGTIRGVEPDRPVSAVAKWSATRLTTTTEGDVGFAWGQFECIAFRVDQLNVRRFDH